MAVTDMLKGMVEELRQDLNEVKGQVNATMKKVVLQVTMPNLGDRRSRGRRISIGSGDA
jgi:hypothetical protein